MTFWNRAIGIAAGTALGITVAVGIVASVGRASTTRAREVHTPRLLPEAEGPITELAMHYVPRLANVVRQPYGDFLRQLPNGVAVRLVVPDGISGRETEQLQQWVASVTPTLWARVTLVRSPGPITTWSKDRSLVTAPTGRGPAGGGPAGGRSAREGAAWLVSPAEPSSEWKERYNDWTTIASLAESSAGAYERHVAPFDFDAGDFAVLDGAIVVDANLIEKNAHRGIRDVKTLKRRLEAWFDTDVVVLGRQPGDTPPHHLSMYMTPLDGKNVLVGDPAAARAVVGSDDFCPGPRSAETGKPLCADFSEATQRKFDRAAEELGRRGFNVPLEPKTYVAYTNGVYETRADHRIAYVPQYDLPALDRVARETYEKLGWDVRPIRVAQIYAYHGTIGCLVNVLARG
jgi:hypothetical protein